MILCLVAVNRGVTELRMQEPEAAHLPLQGALADEKITPLPLAYRGADSDLPTTATTFLRFLPETANEPHRARN